MTASEVPLQSLLRATSRRRRAWFRRERRIPFVQQLTSAECGIACLTMVLHHFGQQVRLDEVRGAFGTIRDGVTALSILEAARRYGLIGRGIRVELDDFGYLKPGAILHWNFNHFVVLDSVDAKGIHIVDPSTGRRRVSPEELRSSFTGVAVLLQPGEGFQRHAAHGSPVVRYLRRVLAHAGLLPRILVVSAVVQVLSFALPALTGALVGTVIPHHDLPLFFLLGAGLAGTVLVQGLAHLVRSHLLLALRTELDAELTVRLVGHLASLPYAFVQQRSSGDLMSRLTSNAQAREILTAGALSGVLDGVLVLFNSLLLVALNVRLWLVAVVAAVAQLAVLVASRRAQAELLARSLDCEARSSSAQYDLIAGMETLKAMGAEDRAVRRWSAAYFDVLNASIDRGRLSALTESLNAVLRAGAPLVVLCLGAWQVMQGAFGLGTFLASAALATGFLVPFSNLMGTAMQLQLIGTHVERIYDILDAAPEQVPGEAPRAPRLEGGISFEHVSFRYGATSPLVVDDVCVDIRPGQLVAIVGPSGSGKSTLAALMLGLYLPTSGRVRFDGLDLWQLDVRSVRAQVGIVLQSPHLFSGSVRSNIALANPDATLEELISAARRAQIDEEIREMPMAYETPILDRGSGLSGGQRQRLALARALVRNPRILLLDEATSALDGTMEARVHRALAELDCTRIVVAHRLSTIVNADLILTLSQGRIVERGRHQELLARGGVYASLVRSQLTIP